MSILDTLPAVFNGAFSGMFRDATLNIPGAQTSDGQGGFTTGAATEKACKALIDDYSDYQRLALGIPAGDRKIIVLAASIADDAVPAVGYTLTVEGREWSVIAMKRDPAAATYELQGR